MALPTALAYLYTSADEIEALLSPDGADARLDDVDSGAVSATEEDYMAVQAVNKATSRINIYLQQRYAPALLATSWAVHDFTTIYGAIWLCRRRGNSVPASLMESWEEDCLPLLEAIQKDQMSLNDIAERESDQPRFANVTLDSRYRVRQLRVERPLSDRVPNNIPRLTHWDSEFTPEW